MTFCIFLLVLITYFYYFFEDRRMLIGGKNIALIFTVLDLSLIVSFLFGKYVHIYARPVALAALLVFVLVGRRDAIFMNMICAILMFVVDNFSDGTAAANNVYSSFIIAFSAGMIAIFFGNKAKTRFQIVGIGLIIVIPVDFIIFLLDGLRTFGQQFGVRRRPSRGSKKFSSRWAMAFWEESCPPCCFWRFYPCSNPCSIA